MGFKSLFGRRKKPDSSTANPNLSPAEVLFVSLSPSVNGRTQIEELELVFKKFDINGDGKISWSELGAIMGSLG
ncbi:putative calcium-binding protein CML25 [Morus notabilis]|uniref:Putative calcium-binding protein CML25 n=1 Tax=Morus notabilis TaxID=981085 RepID=W9RM30_9ROSA|nr:putative calcium-binding protein CML25 [Morus notabilis]